MMRIGRYLQEFEDRVVEVLRKEGVGVVGGKVLGWENYIRVEGRQLKYPYLIPLGGFLSICALSPFLVWLVGATWETVTICVVPAWIACFLSALFVLKKVDSGTVFDGIVAAHPWLRPIFRVLPF